MKLLGTMNIRGDGGRWCVCFTLRKRAFVGRDEFSGFKRAWIYPLLLVWR